MGDAVALAKKSPYAVFVIWVAAIKLYGFQFGKLLLTSSLKKYVFYN